MDPVTERMRDVAQSLFVYEATAITSSDRSIPTASHVSERLRRVISSLAGNVGYRSLLTRALNLAAAEAPCLHAVQIVPEGSLKGLGELPKDEMDRAGTVLIAEVLALLCNFIGEPLTLRLLHDEWPSLPAIDEIPSGGKDDPKP